MANRLIDEDSLYLRQHANNPVNWYPWTKEAFDKALREDKPIFLSIGYSSCHWCHVMERESFENEEIAKELNENFICIKVDKEERPDIDRYFQDVFVTMNARAGGWPLSIFMTPQKIPFYSATYIPPTPKYGIVGFLELIKTIAKSYKDDRESLIKKGKEVLKFLEPKSKIEATKITKSLEDIFISQIKQLYEKEFGGFSSSPKFPHASILEACLSLYQLRGDKELKDILIHTLDSMTLGGLYDIVDGGFCRYSTDNRWLVPHFEKMTYDNGLLAHILIRAYEVTNLERFRELAYQTLDFMIDKMMQDNLFFSASDADSNGVEGEYFVYSYDEVIDAFKKGGINNPKEVAKSLSITPSGNFEGKNIARFKNTSLRDDKEIKRAIEILRSLREKREYPTIDKKIQSSQNAMVIRALFSAGRENSKYLKQAIKSLEALEKKLANRLNLYHSSLIDKAPKQNSFLEDYAWWILALIEAYETTLDENYLIRATALSNEAIKRFYRGGRWLFDDGEFKRFDEDSDTSYPSSLSIMVNNLLSLRSLSDSIYEKFIFKTLEVNSYNLMRQPVARATLALMAIRYQRDDLIIKANSKLLSKYISERLRVGYPFLLYKLTFDKSFMLCNNSSCFMSSKEFSEVAQAVNKYLNS